jgi:hypothetical protein
MNDRITLLPTTAAQLISVAKEMAVTLQKNKQKKQKKQPER